MKRHWKVGELAKLSGVTVRTLRFYDQIGLLSPSDQTESGHRLYLEPDIARLQQIQALKEMGLSLEEIKSFLAGERNTPLEVVKLQIERLRETIRLQQKLLRELEHVAARMRTRDPLGVEEFTQLFETMKQTREKFALERRASWESHLDRLASFLLQSEIPNEPNRPDRPNDNESNEPH
ncbi:hypothetical protein J19TS2_25790 [Cohnella xylanilytica]|uniref:MerR family transcriptional regulator n=1 Tax=Cohnella xylanilytica TaxID=557555 RepID=UPI001B040697|nr:MerR family transcriptional regulator [Cohnella xylanilytica]GIO13024.1 hypothetical protein J19TS2_25790 [Cohnella xylanilytica]